MQMRLGFADSQLPAWMKKPDEAAAAEAEKVPEVHEVQDAEELPASKVVEVVMLGELLGPLNPPIGGTGDNEAPEAQ